MTASVPEHIKKAGFDPGFFYVYSLRLTKQFYGGVSWWLRLIPVYLRLSRVLSLR